MKILFTAVALMFAISACNNSTTEQKEQPKEDTSVIQTELAPGENPKNTISADSLAIFEDLAVDDPEKRKLAIKQVNEILGKYRDRLPNQASYSSMKMFETYTNEFLSNFKSVDQETKKVWVYYIATELMLRAPENEMKNAKETLERIESSCDCNASEKKELKEFDAMVLKQMESMLA